MPKYKCTYLRSESREMELTCEAANEEEAQEKFDVMIRGDDDGNGEYAINFDDMDCFDADDQIDNIEEITE